MPGTWAVLLAAKTVVADEASLDMDIKRCSFPRKKKATTAGRRLVFVARFGIAMLI